ncbi:MAG: mechanosensitive ion channel [Candidatus Eisenbacteria bacterium]|nr:mechanosensitive ion channel [Candidatus Latescibacterota bacterium]MBD3300887.1 mechanosensitive ion channel [Candidatus Eisenbacteria bacterium]
METENVGTMVQKVMEWITTSGLNVIGAILILIVGRIIAGIVRGLVKKVMNRGNQDPGLTNFVGSIVYGLIIVFAFVAALAKFGIETASFIAVLGAVAFAIGFALQGSLSNFAAGVMLLAFRPFRVGDYVEAGGTAGSVINIEIFNTILHTPDNVRIIVPNSKIFADVIKNYSANDTRRLDLVIGIGYGSDIQKAIDVVNGLIQADSRALGDPAPTLAVSELADSSVNLIVRPWVKKEDYWSLRFDLTRAIKESFDKNGIEIPFPQRVVHQPDAPSKN